MPVDALAGSFNPELGRPTKERHSHAALRSMTNAVEGKMKQVKWFLPVVVLLLSSIFSGCDLCGYSQPERWLKLPTAIDREVDVFYLYPTCWKKIDPSEPNICAIDNPTMLAGSAAAYARQATAFEPVGNVFAPYYRQADGAYALGLPPDEREELIASVPAADAAAAFDYYLEHCNNGRPFMLVGHSQGAQILTLLLSDYLRDHPEAYERMIAAYVIGYSVTTDYLQENPHLRFAEGPDDTGVIVSYNTLSPDVALEDVPFLLPGAVAINPISWTRDETLATTGEGLGSYLPDANGVFHQAPQYADARVDTAAGVVVCSTALETELVLGFGPGIYHTYDIPFYYFNLRANAANRTEKFLESL
jgi:pimeloyl-ACP methyl ester carboxylesterase